MVCLTLISCSVTEEKSRIESFLSSAEEFRSGHQFRASMIESKNAIQADPDDARGYISLAKTYIEIGQSIAAIKILERLQEQGAQYTLTIAEAYFNTGETRSAEEVLNRNKANLVGHQLAVNLLLGNLALARGDLNSAEKSFSDVLKKDEANSEAQLGIAAIAVHL
jgi:Tfp pilus assembly protein PilF